MSHDHAASHDAPHEAHAHPNYVKTWAILLVLLVISYFGPNLGIRLVTLITAFGVALVKAFLVARDFMHLNVQRPFVIYLLITALGLMVLLWGAVAPDVMKHEGRNWVNVKATKAAATGHEEVEPPRRAAEAPEH